MVISIKSVEADQLARELARETGETITQAVVHALKSRLEQFQNLQNREIARTAVRTLTKYYQNLPNLDHRTQDEILCYDERGLL